MMFGATAYIRHVLHACERKLQACLLHCLCFTAARMLRLKTQTLRMRFVVDGVLQASFLHVMLGAAIS